MKWYISTNFKVKKPLLIFSFFLCTLPENELHASDILNLKQVILTHKEVPT